MNEEEPQIDTDSSQFSKFSTYSAAASYSAKTVKPSVIVLGDDELYWVVSMALASKLEKRGYEVI